jgi:integrase
MAWPEQLDSGNWRAGYRKPGSPRKYYTDAYKLKRDALEAAQEEEVKARRQAALTKGALSARILWGDWWDLIAPTRDFVSAQPRIEGYTVERYLRPMWGQTPLNRIEQRDVQNWVNALVAGTADGWDHPGRQPKPKYVRNIYKILKVSISRAVREGVLTASPCDGVRIPRAGRQVLPYLPVDDAESLRLRADYRDAVDFGLETGLRPGELCGFHAERIDWRTKWMYVAEVYVEGKKVIRPQPKDDDVRKVPLSSAALAILKRRLADRDLKSGCGIKHSDGHDCESALVFLTDRDKPMTPSGLRAAMQRAAKSAELPQRGGYALRRGFATRVSPRLSAIELALIMGHADLNQLKPYVQETPEARARALAALGEVPELRAVEDVGQPGAGSGADLESGRVGEGRRQAGGSRA